MLSTVKGWDYQHVSEYLGWAKPRLAAIRAGENSGKAKEWLREFLKALHTRINRKAMLPVEANTRRYQSGPTYRAPDGHLFTRANESRWTGWRKLDCDYQISLWRDSRKVREIATSRVRHYQFETVEARSRFSHLLASYAD